jgi:signal transduction histidine kinase
MSPPDQSGAPQAGRRSRRLAGPRARAARWVGACVPRRTVRLRLTLMYGGLFLVSGAALLAITYGLVTGSKSEVVSFSRGGVQGSILGVAPGPGPEAARTLMLHLPSGASVAGGQISRSVRAGGHTSRSVSPAGPVLVSPKQVQVQTQRLQTLAIAQHSAELHQLLVNSGIALAIMAFASMLLGWLIAGRVLRPLHEITNAVRAISASNLHKRLALDGPDDELTELGDTFDGLLARLETSFRSQRQFVANASHELRTPLTVERALIEVALADPDADYASLRAACERVLASGEEQERLIEALLTLAGSERGLERREPVDLGVLTGEVLLTREAEIERRGLKVDTRIDSAPSLGDPSLIERLVGNLLDNALRHNMTGGWVKVATGMGGDVRGSFISVSNGGPVIPPEEVERLFRPFRRLAPERAGHGDGHGLGLSIVQAVATAHGASVVARALTDGGLAVEVSFLAPNL